MAAEVTCVSLVELLGLGSELGPGPKLVPPVSEVRGEVTVAGEEALL